MHHQTTCLHQLSNHLQPKLNRKQLQYESIKAQLAIAQAFNTKIIVTGKSNVPLIMDTQKWFNTFAQNFWMITIELERVHGDYGFEVKDMFGHSVKIDNSPEHGGDNFGVRPMQMLLMGLAGCSGMDVISILKKQRQTIKSYKTIVNGEREKGAEPSLWKFIEIEFIITGDVDEDKAKRAVELSVNKYCSVAATLMKAGATIKSSVTIKKD